MKCFQALSEKACERKNKVLKNDTHFGTVSGGQEIAIASSKYKVF